VDDTDESILHAVARELKEETGLEAIKIVRKVGEFGWDEFSERRQERFVWRKFIFEVEVKKAEDVKLDPVEHQDYLWASEEEVNSDKAGNIPLSWITAPNKNMNLEAFRLRREKNDGVSL
jgi:8-oxo-dGTP pyrophosphatase MutT (NUDIX family)